MKTKNKVKAAAGAAKLWMALYVLAPVAIIVTLVIVGIDAC